LTLGSALQKLPAARLSFMLAIFYHEIFSFVVFFPR
jgi:hypothetical protein